MATTITLDPVTRIEGHLQIDVTVDLVGGVQQVVAAKCSGTMFRGFETLLQGRDPRDAALYTQRICGVCPVSHAMASSLALDQAFGVSPPHNGRILRNLVLGANFIQSHLLHFYHLSVLDYVNTTGLLDMSPWTPRHITADMAGGAYASTLVNHYIEALHMRRKAHQMGALFGGKLPCTASLVVGGCTQSVSGEQIDAFRALLTELRQFVQNTYLEDVSLLSSLFPAYFNLGVGNGNLLAFGVFDLDDGGNRLFDSGRVTGGVNGDVDPAAITEYVEHSWYTAGSGAVNPAQGVTEPDPDKPDAYSWLKAPRYQAQTHELGPLARMWVNGHYLSGPSAMDRIVARAQETQLIADAMDGWLDQLVPGQPTINPASIPAQATAIGLTEAPRGALGHWLSIDSSTVSRYQVITPTNWNASPRDHLDQPGPMEAALVGTPVQDLDQPIEVLRVVHTYDPCLACAVHVMRPAERLDRSHIILSAPPQVGSSRRAP